MVRSRIHWGWSWSNEFRRAIGHDHKVSSERFESTLTIGLNVEEWNLYFLKARNAITFQLPRVGRVRPVDGSISMQLESAIRGTGCDRFAVFGRVDGIGAVDAIDEIASRALREQRVQVGDVSRSIRDCKR